MLPDKVLSIHVTTPLISVILPVYNGAHTIIDTLQSIYRQTYGNFEVIIINDGSVDNSVELIEDFISTHEKKSITWKLFMQSNKGVSAARNLGLENITGDYIALLDADDQWLPEKTERQLSILQGDDNIDFIGAAYNERLLRQVCVNEMFKVTSRKLLYKNFFQPSTVIFKKIILKQAGFFKNTMNYMEDRHYWLRITMAGFNCVFLNESLAVVGNRKPEWGHSGLSANLLAMEKGELYILKYAYKKNVVGVCEYAFLVLFSLAKFFRRCFISLLRKMFNS